MGKLDESVMSLSMQLGNRVSRRGFLGRAAAATGVLVGGPAAALIFAPGATATHNHESIQCEYYPVIQGNGCPYCIGGSWLACDGRCGNQAREWFDCCHQCQGGCYTAADPSDPNGRGYVCCFTGYCVSGCSGKKVICRFWRCHNLLCGP